MDFPWNYALSLFDENTAKKRPFDFAVFTLNPPKYLMSNYGCAKGYKEEKLAAVEHSGDENNGISTVGQLLNV